MRILHLVRHLGNYGDGVVNSLIDLTYAQTISGLDVAIASKGGDYESLLAQHQIKHFYLNPDLKLSNILAMPLNFRKILSDFQPDIVHIHVVSGMLLSSLFQIFSNYKTVSTIHCEFRANSMIMGLADRVITVSKAVGKSMQNRGVSKSKIRVVVNGTIGSPRIRPMHEYLPMQLNHPNITTVCGIFVRKGIAELIDAFLQIAAEHPNLHLYLIGSGDINLFQSLAQNSPFYNRIHFEGFQPEPQRYLLSTDIFVLASHNDPAPLVIPEARTAGCAIIATNVDGIPELLNHGDAGILVPAKNSSTLAKELNHLLSNFEEIQMWKSRAKANIENFNIFRVHEEVLDVYNELLS